MRRFFQEISNQMMKKHNSIVKVLLGFCNQFQSHNIVVLNCLRKENKISKNLKKKIIDYLKELKFLMNLLKLIE